MSLEHLICYKPLLPVSLKGNKILANQIDRYRDTRITLTSTKVHNQTNSALGDKSPACGKGNRYWQKIPNAPFKIQVVCPPVRSSTCRRSRHPGCLIYSEILSLFHTTGA